MAVRLDEEQLQSCRHRKRRYPVDHRKLMFLHYGHECVWCSRRLNEDTLTVDHVLCVNDGGSDWIGNLLPACGPCNDARLSISAEVWLQECLANGQDVREPLVLAALKRTSDPYALHPIYKEVKQQRARMRGRLGAVKRSWERYAETLWEQPLDLQAELVSARNWS